MGGNIHVLYPQSAPLAGFLRVGHTGHRKLEAMLAAGRFPYKRVVFDAAHIAKQRDFVKSLSESGCEIVLDPNFAEMAANGRFESAVSKLPWSNSERPWEPSDFEARRNFDVAKQVAEFAVEHGVNVVLSLSHVVEQATNDWHATDINMCEALRLELDRSGGSNIAIDHQLLTTSAFLQDGNGRASLVSDIGDLPIENIWLRVSGFGATATGVGTRKYIEAARELHYLNRPLIADFVGGFAGLAAGAFGAVSGISHGVGQHESFSVSTWKHKSTGNGGGTAKRIYIPDLDRFFKEDQLNAIFDAQRGRSSFGCRDKSCCPHGLEDMIENADAHFLIQRRKQLNDLSSVPLLRREEHFIMKTIFPAVRSARLGVTLKIADEKVAMAVNKAKKRLVGFEDTLYDLHESNSSESRSILIPFRGSGRPINAASGWI